MAEVSDCRLQETVVDYLPDYSSQIAMKLSEGRLPETLID